MISKQEQEIESCKYCNWLSKLSNLDEMIQEDGECIVDEKTEGYHGDRYYSEGEKEYELICKDCNASWVWEKHWITDNGGWGIKRNGVEFDF